MKTNFNLIPMELMQSALHAKSINDITLCQLINNLVINSYETATQKNTNIVNEVGQGIAIGTDVSKVCAVMEELILTVVSNSKNGNIHITADRFRDVVILEIQERNNNNGYALAYQIGGIEPDAAALGGHISITGPQKKITTVTFSFPTILQVA